MSFILDALKKSETDRQQQSSAEFTGVPTSSDSPGVPRWLLALGLLLAINLVVLLGLLLRSQGEPTAQMSAPVTENRTPMADKPVEASTAELSFAEKIAKAERNQPAPQDVAEAVPQPSPSVAPDVRASRELRASAPLPTIHEVVANGTIELPELHLDIHVFSDVPKDRFVFINMSKQREKSQLAEGPVVEEITPEGVVLEYRGTSFLLPRD